MEEASLRRNGRRGMVPIPVMGDRSLLPVCNTMLVKAGKADGMPSDMAPSAAHSTYFHSSKTLRSDKPQGGKNPVGLQLEQWLRSVHARRRDA